MIEKPNMKYFKFLLLYTFIFLAFI